MADRAFRIPDHGRIPAARAAVPTGRSIRSAPKPWIVISPPPPAFARGPQAVRRARPGRYVHIDSGEIGNPDWTPKLGADFQRLRGYDPFPYFAAKAGQIVDDPATTERFLEDYERTIGDLMIECYYGHLSDWPGSTGWGP